MTWSWPERPRRVVITGMGTVNALGNDVATTWEGMVAGRSGITAITQFDPSRVTAKIAGIESTAKTTSVSSTTSRVRKSGVAVRRPFSRTKKSLP